MFLDVIVSGAGLGGKCGVTLLFPFTPSCHTDLLSLRNVMIRC